MDRGFCRIPNCSFRQELSIDKAVTDFPEPDSPTRASVLPFWIFKEMLSTALDRDSLVSKSLDFFISRILSTACYGEFKIHWLLVL